MKINLIKHQAEFIEAKERHVALVGGYRSGKTFSLCLKSIILSLTNKSNPFGAILEPTEEMIARVLIPTIEPILEGSGLSFKIFKNQNKRIELYPPDGVKRTIWLCGAENYTRLVGMTLSWGAIDEIDVIKTSIAHAAYNQLASRLTNGDQLQLITSSTPEGFKFLYDFFITQPTQNPKLAEGRRIIKAKTANNPFIHADYVDEIKRRYPQKLAMAYLDGEFVNLTEGQVYYAFDEVGNKIQAGTHLPTSELHIGVDFNVGQMAAVVGVQRPDGIYFIDEIIGCANTDALIKKIKSRYPNSHIKTYPDSSGKNASANASKSSIQLLEEAGLNPQYKSTNPAVVDRVTTVNARLTSMSGAHSIFIDFEKCPQLVKGLREQGYTSAGEPDKSRGLDHALDAFGYCVCYLYPLGIQASVKVRRF